MSTVKGKYLKDESNNVISPITSTETIYDTSGNPMGGVLYQLVRYYHMLVKLLRQII